ncbi:MAG: cell division protein ZapA [Rhodocyclaceae bacterium]|nr:cell division protein ZapA [Rhodocyclaceae bacterium]
MTTTIDIKIQGREYRVACAPSETEALMRAAAILDAKMGEIAAATRATGERLAIMAALNLAHELDTLRATTSRVAPSENSIDADVDAERLIGRIKAIEARLDAALAPQEQLF